MMRRFAADTAAATAVEYAVMTFIAIAIVAAISALGGSVTGLYNQVAALFAN
jgi:Flp pilus assembly pilin Flp